MAFFMNEFKGVTTSSAFDHINNNNIDIWEHINRPIHVDAVISGSERLVRFKGISTRAAELIAAKEWDRVYAPRGLPHTKCVFRFVMST